jgi:hypothetical protein
VTTFYAEDPRTEPEPVADDTYSVFDDPDTYRDQLIEEGRL